MKENTFVILLWPIKRGQIKKIVEESNKNPPISSIKWPYFFWFDLFLEARAEILEKFSLVRLSKRWHQKDILKLTDL